MKTQLPNEMLWPHFNIDLVGQTEKNMMQSVKFGYWLD